MDITNKTRKPLSLPLPGGKKLFLGPGKTGQVTPKALEHPPIAALLASGDLETADDSHARQESAPAGKTAAPAGPARQKGTGAMRQSGDR